MNKQNIDKLELTLGKMKSKMIKLKRRRAKIRNMAMSKANADKALAIERSIQRMYWVIDDINNDIEDIGMADC